MGVVREKDSGERLSGVHLRQLGASQVATSNASGFFVLGLSDCSTCRIVASYVGYEEVLLTINPNEWRKDSILVINMSLGSLMLDEFELKAENKVTSLHVAPQRLSVPIVTQMPTLFGEKDVFKTIQLLPGVQTRTEGFNALYVRGGDPGQNLIMLDDAVVYNINHLFGLFSPFNGDAIKTADFWVSQYPARFGDRASSVIDIQLKDGNKEAFHGEVGIGLISSRLWLEGPLVKDKVSFLIAGRRTYLDLLTRPFMSKENQFAYRFYDLNTKINIDIDPRNTLTLSTFSGDDHLEVLDEFSTSRYSSSLDWGNRTAAIKWRRIIGNSVSLRTTATFSRFRIRLEDQQTNSQLQMDEKDRFQSSVRDFGLKMDFDHFLNNQHQLRYGLNITHHHFAPFRFESTTGRPSIDQGSYRSLEQAIYVEDTWKPSPQTTVNLGVRLSGMTTDGFSQYNAVPRLSFNQQLGDYRLGVSYIEAQQYVHLLSNTGSGFATDLWLPSSDVLPPQSARHLVFHASKQLKKGYLVSYEAYRKWFGNIVSYAEGANFFELATTSNTPIEDDIRLGEGTSYGSEFMIKKETGRLTGWLAYTLNWTVHTFEDINNGNPFFPSFDSRHNIGLLSIYEINPRITLAATWSFHSGQALTVPTSFFYGKYSTGDRIFQYHDGENFVSLPPGSGNITPYFSGRNNFRGEAFHRLDVSIRFTKQKTRWKRAWEFGIYNFYNRSNPFLYHLFRENKIQGQRIVLKKRSLFPILPSVSYHISF